MSWTVPCSLLNRLTLSSTDLTNRRPYARVSFAGCHPAGDSPPRSAPLHERREQESGPRLPEMPETLLHGSPAPRSSKRCILPPLLDWLSDSARVTNEQLTAYLADLPVPQCQDGATVEGPLSDTGPGREHMHEWLITTPPPLAVRPKPFWNSSQETTAPGWNPGSNQARRTTG
jgi:hypothetical protein